MTKTDINPSLSRALILVRKETVHTSNTTGHIWVAERLAGGGGGSEAQGGETTGRLGLHPEKVREDHTHSGGAAGLVGTWRKNIPRGAKAPKWDA